MAALGVLNTTSAQLFFQRLSRPWNIVAVTKIPIPVYNRFIPMYLGGSTIKLLALPLNKSLTATIVQGISAVPVAGIRCILYYTVSGFPIDYTLSDSNGIITFNELPDISASFEIRAHPVNGNSVGFTKLSPV